MMRAISKTTWSSVTPEPVFRGGGVEAPLVLKVSAQARVMRLRVDARTGKVILTLPRRASRKRAVEWAESKRGWIEAALAKVTPPTAIAAGATIPFRGADHAIHWQADRRRTIEWQDGVILLGGPADAVATRVLRWLKQEAKRLLTQETQEYAAKAGVDVSRVSIGDQLSCWGSCSSSGAIRYSWRLILAPDHVRRATVAHEVAHRIHMNHGPDFHALVERLFEADPRPANEWLKRHGAGLHRIGTRAA